MIERGDQLERLGQEHAVAEHVARHVAAPCNPHRLGLHIQPEFEEMAPHRQPCALGGDAHRLVVIALRAAACERIVEPEVALGSNGIGNVGKRRGALVGGDDEVRVFAIKDGHAGGMDHFAVNDVVGHRQQRADEYLVAGLSFGQPALAILGRIGQVLGIEAALGAGRHDHRVLHALRLHQPQHFGAEIVAAVRPAQAATRHRPGAQVDALDARAVNEDLAPGQRLGQAGHLRGIDLEGERFGRGGGKGIGAKDRVHQRAERTQQAIVIDRGNARQSGHNPACCVLCCRCAIAHKGGIVARNERVDQPARNFGRVLQRIDHGGNGISHARLPQIAEPRAQPVGLARRKADRHDQPVERVVLGRAVQHRGQRPFDGVRAREQRVGRGVGRMRDKKIMDEAELALVERGRHFLEHAEAEVFEHGHGV